LTVLFSQPKDPNDRYQRACDEEDRRKDAENMAADALARGDIDEYSEQMKEANRHEKRYMQFMYGVTPSDQMMPPQYIPKPPERGSTSENPAPPTDLPLPELPPIG
jgi:hypothetical protein